MKREKNTLRHLNPLSPTQIIWQEEDGTLEQKQMSSSLWVYDTGRGWTMVTNVLSCPVVDTETCHPAAPAMKGLSQLLGMLVAENFQLLDLLGHVSMAGLLCLPAKWLTTSKWLTNIGRQRPGHLGPMWASSEGPFEIQGCLCRWLRLPLGLHHSSTLPSLQSIPSHPQTLISGVPLNKPLACGIQSPESSPLQA